MPALHLENQLGLIRLSEIHQRTGSLVCKVDVVGARELRRLAAFVMAGTTTVLLPDVFPQVDLERLHVRV